VLSGPNPLNARYFPVPIGSTYKQRVKISRVAESLVAPVND
jgi:hypothetical protein